MQSVHINHENFAATVLEHGGSIHPLLIPSSVTGGTGIMNPSVCQVGHKLCMILRHVNYTFYHSEAKLFQHPWGPLTYVHPENDCYLRTVNYYCELNDNLEIVRHNKIDTSRFDTYEPQWDFVGLEDARLFEWQGKLYTSGVRRDTTTNGQGRMELCEIAVTDHAVTEVSRWRIPPPNDPNSYCEKNWMPVLDQPYHYVKWSNPTEVVQVDPVSESCRTVHLNSTAPLPVDPRGGSQVIPWGNDHYLALTHEVDLFNSEVGRKDAVYRHRFVLWTRSWEPAGYSHAFSLMNGHVEFAAGMCHTDNNQVLISFGFQDNAAYLLRVPAAVIDAAIEES